MSPFSKKLPFVWSANENGLAIRFSDARRYSKAKFGRASGAVQLAFIRMQMLLESGQAEVRDVDFGIFISSADAVRLDRDTRERFVLPPHWPGGFRLQTTGIPQLKEFYTRIGLVNPDATVFWDWSLRGPILEAGGLDYLPTPAQYAALKAWQNWNDSSEKDEFCNLGLLATLQEAKDNGLFIYLDAYQETTVAQADDLSLDAREDANSGDLILRPLVTGPFPELNPDDIENRLAQLQTGTDRTIIRVGQTIVLLSPEQTEVARAVAVRNRVPKKDRQAFETNPSVWLAEHVFPDVEIEFSPRVTGIGCWSARYLGSNWEERQDWFGKKPHSEKRADTRPIIEPEEPDKPDIVPNQENRPVVPLIIPNDEELAFGWHFQGLAAENAEPFKIDFCSYRLRPYPHQEEAVRWLLCHARRALQRGNFGNAENGYGAGALLADDMGLGKTFSALVCIAEWFQLWRRTMKTEPFPVLIVAPLSLLENWKSEIENCFGSDQSVFSRILVAQAEAELWKVRRGPTSRDVARPGEVEQYGLGFGDRTEGSIDFPGGCVITTYQTLRDYRFSFAKAEWSAAIFDEAQNIKNPNALQTIAAKSLKAKFRITMTGTPVENHLGDFWSIIDTAEPGPLGSFAEFRHDWIQRMIRDREHMIEIGTELREKVGGLMLRRIKEDELKGLPPKSGSDLPIHIDMSPIQASAYRTIVDAVHLSRTPQNEDEKMVQNRQLAALWQLRQVSLHPDLLGGGQIPAANNQASSRATLSKSGKLAWLLEKLDGIRKADEKALIYCVQKKLQEALSHHLGQIYEIQVPVINGDTKSSSKRKPETTRLGLIDQFSNNPGFGICVLSPIAAGAGLNIVAANHVIHLERHWNPAKEDQATDRVYRIGQNKPVFVYLPTTIHPDMASFDVVLHRLIERKRNLQKALGLIPPESVTAPELINEVFGHTEDKSQQIEYMNTHDALGLSWSLFEALIATIYEQQAERVILTPGSADHGCDVVVFGWGPQRENILIQCKSTSRDKLDGDSGIRELQGARPFYEDATGAVFHHCMLHTTAKRCSKRTMIAAELCHVAIHGRSWIDEILDSIKIAKSAVLARDTRREKIV